MRNRNVAAYRKHVGVSATSLRALEERVRTATQRYKKIESAHMQEIEEQVKAAEELARAQEELERAKARVAQLELRRGRRL